MMASALEDEETQSKGIVLVVLNYAPTWIFDSFWAAWKAIRVPFRIARLQYCVVSPGSIYSFREYEEHGTTIRIHQGTCVLETASPFEIIHGIGKLLILPSHIILLLVL
jgi:hypothetical protein